MRCRVLEELIAFAIIMPLVYWAIDTLIRKKYNIKNKKFWEEANYVNEFHKSGERSVIILYVIFILIVLIYYPRIFHYSFIFFITIGIFRAFMEWKFERSSKRYMLSILFAVSSLIILIGFELLLT